MVRTLAAVGPQLIGPTAPRQGPTPLSVSPGTRHLRTVREDPRPQLPRGRLVSHTATHPRSHGTVAQLPGDKGHAPMKPQHGGTAAQATRAYILTRTCTATAWRPSHAHPGLCAMPRLTPRCTSKPQNASPHTHGHPLPPTATDRISDPASLAVTGPWLRLHDPHERVAHRSAEQYHAAPRSTTRDHAGPESRWAAHAVPEPKLYRAHSPRRHEGQRRSDCRAHILTVHPSSASLSVGPLWRPPPTQAPAHSPRRPQPLGPPLIAQHVGG